MVALVNGVDEDAVDYLLGLDWVNEMAYLPGATPVPIGDAVSFLVDAVPGDCRYHLHLEDDWECVSGGWYNDAKAILEASPYIGQVRLRLASEPTLRRHLITGKPHEWEPARLGRIGYATSGLHYTYNPSLCRVGDLSKIHPASHEKEAMRHYLAAFPRVAQLLPGAFRHIGGGGGSLRCKLGRQ